MSGIPEIVLHFQYANKARNVTRIRLQLSGALPVKVPDISAPVSSFLKWRIVVWVSLIIIIIIIVFIQSEDKNTYPKLE